MNKNNDCCQKIIDVNAVNNVKEHIWSGDSLERVTTLFKALGDPTRAKILSVLFQEELCVHDIAYLLEMSQSAISHQLRVLNAANITKKRKDGKMVYYSLKDNHIKNIVSQAYEHVAHE